VHYTDGSEATHLLGLIAEKATETMRCEAGDFVASGISNDKAPYLGPIVSDTRGLVQRIEVNKLLTAAVREVLFRLPVEHA
jgi:chemotaxis-related protein WspB